MVANKKCHLLLQVALSSLIYEKMKKDFPHESREWRYKTIPLFREEVKRLDNLHATNIQKVFRGRKVRKDLRSMKEQTL